MVTNLVPLLPWQCHRGVQWPSTVKRKTDKIKPGIDYKQLQTVTNSYKQLQTVTNVYKSIQVNPSLHCFLSVTHLINFQLCSLTLAPHLHGHLLPPCLRKAPNYISYTDRSKSPKLLPRKLPVQAMPSASLPESTSLQKSYANDVLSRNCFCTLAT